MSDAIIQHAERSLLDFALYHPWPYFVSRPIGEWVKSMLLFFDGVAVLGQPEVVERLLDSEPETLAPLFDEGLFRVLEPATLIDDAGANRIVDFLTELAANTDPYVLKILSGGDIEGFDDPAGAVYAREGGLFMHVRLPWNIAPTMSSLEATIWPEFIRRGLVRKRPDGSWWAHKVFWATYEALLAYTLRSNGQRCGIDLFPATDDRQLVRRFRNLLDIDVYPSAGHIVTFDLEEVTLDLSRQPIGEILTFRAEHGYAYRKYARNLREFAREIALLDHEHRAQAFRARKEELADAADDLARISRRSWAPPVASLSVGLAGGAWFASQGDWAEGTLAVLAGIAGALPRPQLDEAYSYLFQAQETLGWSPSI